MAITIVTSVFTTAAGAAGSVRLIYTGTQENDIAVTWGGFAGGTATAPGVVSPSGYASVWVVDSASNDFKIEWKRLGATPDTSVLLRMSGDANDAVGYGAFVLRGVVTDPDPFDVPIRTSIAVGVPNVPSIVTVTDEAMVLALGANDINDTSPGVLTRFANNFGGSTNDTDDFTIAGAASIIATAGSIYPSVWTTWASGNYVTAAVALRPASTAAGTFIYRVPLLSTTGAG